MTESGEVNFEDRISRHVILKEFFVDKTTPYFDSYVKKYSDLPFLVKLEPCENGYRTGMMLRASDFPDHLGITQNAEWYPVLLDEADGGMVIPNGCIGSRWNNEGKWNLRNEDLRTGKAYTPLLSVMDRKSDFLCIHLVQCSKVVEEFQ